MGCYCTACQRHFATIHAYRRHRVGTFRPNARRCRSEAEMLRVSLIPQSDVWHLLTPLELLQEFLTTQLKRPRSAPTPTTPDV